MMVILIRNLNASKLCRCEIADEVFEKVTDIVDILSICVKDDIIAYNHSNSNVFNFSVRLCFPMTINKAHGVTAKH